MLLLRMFAQDLFRQGEAPGPKCLTKWLRSRFNAVSPKYSETDAQDEYMHMAQAWKEQRKQRYTTYECGLCGVRFPPEGFGAENHKTEDVLQLCIHTGSWRMCLACRQVQTSAKDTASGQKLCLKCGQTRSKSYFASTSETCASCSLVSRFETIVCSTCGKTCRANATTEVNK